MSGRFIRMVEVFSVTALAVIGLTISAIPAQAYPPGAGGHHATISYSAGTVTATAFETQRVNGDLILTPDPVAIQLWNPGAGFWLTMISGTGNVTYQCWGTATNTFRVHNAYVTKQLVATCG